MDLKSQFEEAAARSRDLPSQPNDVLLELYALYKQATDGDVTGSRPGMFDMVGRAKFDAWSGLRGIPVDEAMRRYIDRVDALLGEAT
jgi:diazepam-binding inhibitor (GABA receptor modulating acyl-CoA-binding protein)